MKLHEKSSLILKWFEEHPGESVSGEELSKMLNCSRTAVWKHINRLKEIGYEFEAVPKVGYRLLFEPDQIEPQRLQQLLKTKKFGRKFHTYQSVYTTMQTAHQHLSEGEGTVVLAELQTKGKGRLGRDWHSPAGKGLWFSTVLQPSIPLQQVPQLTLVTSAALCRTIRQFCGIEAKIKWPNDILVDGKKICGILMESSAENERLHHCIAGVGINVNLKSDDFSADIQNKATSLQMESGKIIDRTALLAAFLNEWEAHYEMYLENGFAPIRTIWEALTDMIGRPVHLVVPTGESLDGEAAGLDESGALLVKTADGKIEKVYSGEIPIQ